MTSTLATPASSTEAPPSTDVSALFRLHGDFLLRALARHTADRAGAEDVLQQTFIIAHQKQSNLTVDGNPRAWLYRVAMNVLRHERRSYARRTRLGDALAHQPQHASTSDDVVAARQRVDKVRQAVLKLDEPFRSVFILFELEGVSQSEIAEMVGCAPSTVATRVFRAREQFKRFFDGSDS